MLDKCNVLKNIKIFLLAFCLTVPAVLLSRLISPRATIDSSYIFLAWLPLWRHVFRAVLIWPPWRRADGRRNDVD
ncbi:protein YfeA [Salmonella enterica subsp. enterica serovar Madelia]|nr:protein YfeA [Salmonella enterica subsp. enterica serovar Madelia]